MLKGTLKGASHISGFKRLLSIGKLIALKLKA